MFWKTWAKTLFPRQNRIITILRNQVVKQAIEEPKKKSEIIVILNIYKDTLNDFIDNLDPKSPNWRKLIDGGLRNMYRSASSSMRLLERGCLNKDVLNCRSIELAPKTGDFHVHPHRNIALCGPMNRKKHYKKGEKDGED